MSYLWAVYSVLWAITFAYLVYLGIQQSQLRQQLRVLRETDNARMVSDG